MLLTPRQLLWRCLTDMSYLSLALSNLITVGMAVIQNWSLSTVMWVYWWQSVIIGFFTCIKILALRDYDTEGLTINGRPATPSFKVNVIMAGFFTVHYGLFHFGYFMFLRELPSGEDMSYLLMTAGIFFLNHLFSMAYNRQRDREKGDIKRLMIFPYARIVPMHLTVIIGIPVAAIAGANRFVVAFFLLLKTFADLSMHYLEHATPEELERLRKKMQGEKAPEEGAPAP